jgi:hypothetical protein
MPEKGDKREHGIAEKIQKGMSARMGKKGMTGKGEQLQSVSPPPKPPDSADSAKPKN